MRKTLLNARISAASKRLSRVAKSIYVYLVAVKA